MYPTIGRVVHYHTTETQRLKMKNRTDCNVSELLPATIVAVLGPSTVNLNVHLDGDGNLWATYATQGTGEGQWEWPKIETDLPHMEEKDK